MERTEREVSNSKGWQRRRKWINRIHLKVKWEKEKNTEIILIVKPGNKQPTKNNVNKEIL
jgi:hypothetical protein